jgi:hypothetical protein
MTRPTGKVEGTRPKNVFTKPLEINWKELLKALSKGLGHTAIGKWEEAPR